MEVTPDNNFVIVAEPAGWSGLCLVPPYFTVYDISQNQVEQVKFRIDTAITTYWDTNEIVITPDGQHLIGTSSSKGQLMDYDIQSGQFLHRFEFAYGNFIRTLSIQTNP